MQWKTVPRTISRSSVPALTGSIVLLSTAWAPARTASSSQSRLVSGTSRTTFASGSAAWTSAMRFTACGGAPRSSTMTTSGRESASTAPTGAWPAT